MPELVASPQLPDPPGRHGSDAPPRDRLWGSLQGFGRDLLAALRVANITALASQVAYSLIFAMPSILLVVALIAAEIDHRTGFAISTEVRNLIVTALPAQIEDTVNGLVNEAIRQARQQPTTFSAVVSIAMALFAAGNGLGELATAYDRAAGIIDDRPDWQKRMIFAVSAVLIALLLLIAFTLYVFGGDLITVLGPRFGAGEGMARAWEQLQAPIIVLLVFIGTTILYMTNCGCYTLRYNAPGALISTLLWLLVIKGFALYLQIAPPSTAYGAASSVLIFLVFLYLSSMALIIGSFSSAVIVRRARQSEAAHLASNVHPVPTMGLRLNELDLGHRG
ncbi:MAG: YihY/virulence factor BrkB family protein [Thermomicrobiales bacterium]